MTVIAARTDRWVGPLGWLETPLGIDLPAGVTVELFQDLDPGYGDVLFLRKAGPVAEVLLTPPHTEVTAPIRGRLELWGDPDPDVARARYPYGDKSPGLRLTRRTDPQSGPCQHHPDLAEPVLHVSYTHPRLALQGCLVTSHVVYAVHAAVETLSGWIPYLHLMSPGCPLHVLKEAAISGNGFAASAATANPDCPDELATGVALRVWASRSPDRT